jgi:hypothetical protein
MHLHPLPNLDPVFRSTPWERYFTVCVAAVGAGTLATTEVSMAPNSDDRRRLGFRQSR